MSEYSFRLMHVDPPGPNRKIRWEAPDGTMHEQDAPSEQKYLLPTPQPLVMDEQRIRSLIREEVHRALYPDAALANPHKHMRVEMTTEQGEKWRGVLYAVMPEEAVVPRSGICWACLKPGEDLEWYTSGGRSHLIHQSEACRTLAAEKPESKEHRG